MSKKFIKSVADDGPSPSELWDTIEKRRAARDAKRQAVMSVAAEMFLEQGTHRVSLNAIADRLRITKPALYNYFKSRDEILFECFQLSNEMTAELLSTIERTNDAGLLKLGAFIRGYASLVTRSFGAVMLRLDDRDLPDEKRTSVRRYKREIDSRVRTLIVNGIADGSLNDCDPKLAAFSIFGALNWIAQWYLPSKQLSITQIGDHFAAQILGGLARQP
jgi:AcrR family transcriptional regulator